MVSNHRITAPPFVAVTHFLDFKTGEEKAAMTENVLSPKALEDYNERTPLTYTPTPHYRLTECGRVAILRYYTKGQDGQWSIQSDKDPRRSVVDSQLSDEDEALLEAVMPEFSKL